MPNLLDFMDQLLNSGSSWVYAVIFAIALLEGFVLTTFLINGTIAIVAIGALLAQGYLNPIYALTCIYVGTLSGDSLSYFLSARLQKFKAIAGRLQAYDSYRAPLARRPFVFTILGHFTPYLKGMNAFLAGGILPWKSWLLADVIGALCGTLFLTGLGAAGSYLFTFGIVNAIHFYAGIAILFFIFIFWFSSNSVCKLGGDRNSPSLFCPRHRNWKRLFFLLYYPFWHPIRWVEALLRKFPSRALRKNLREAFPDVRAGDIFLIRLHAMAPWGKWAHSAIALGNNRFCHGFGKIITKHRLEALPIRYAIVHLRVKCDESTANHAAVTASEMIGKRVSILARNGDTSKFSCAGLIFYAYKQAGIALVDHKIPRVVPDDLINSPYIEIVRTVFTESTRVQKNGKGISKGDEQLV